MNKMARNTYSNDLVLERLKRERAKTIKAESKKPKGSVPLWLQALLGSQVIVIGTFTFVIAGLVFLSVLNIIDGFAYIEWSLPNIYRVGK